MRIPINLLRKLRPSQYDFLTMISDLINFGMLRKIAEADYGYKADYCFSELKKIKETKRIPVKIEFALKEVLELTRWIEAKTKDEHIMRVFACSCLLILNPKLANIDDENETLASFIESTLTFDSKYQEAALQLITWRILYDYEKALKENTEKNFIFYPDTFFIFALLQLMILNQESQAEIMIILKWLIEDENSKRNENSFVNNQTFLLGLTNYNSRHQTWNTITSQMLARIDYIADKDIKDKLVEIADCIFEKRE